jgi:hypothetical protein
LTDSGSLTDQEKRTFSEKSQSDYCDSSTQWHFSVEAIAGLRIKYLALAGHTGTGTRFEGSSGRLASTIWKIEVQRIA